MTDTCARDAADGRTGPQPARHLQEFRRRLGADRHRSRRPCRRGRGAGRRQRRGQVDAGQDPRRRASADLGHDQLPRQAGHADRSRAPRSALGIATVFQDLALCENLDVVANIFLGQELSPLPARRGGDGGPGLDAAQRACRPHPQRARADRLALRRPAPDRGDRPLAAARSRSSSCSTSRPPPWASRRPPRC